MPWSPPRSTTASTTCYPGWNVPAEILPGQRFVDLPQAEGVWHHWYEFLCGLLLNNWICRMAAQAQELNRSESLWKGVMYFGLHHWSLPYEQVRNRAFSVPRQHRGGAWGRQRGIDLACLAAHRDSDIVVCETDPPVAANLEGVVAEYARITHAAQTTFDAMPHHDDRWPLHADEEAARWALINKYRPTVITRYQLYLAIENIDHTKTKARSPQTNGICERFHKTVLQESYQVAFRKKIYRTLEELQADLGMWSKQYNDGRPHSGKYCFGKTPAQTFLDSIPLAKEKMLDSTLQAVA